MIHGNCNSHNLLTDLCLADEIARKIIAWEPIARQVGSRERPDLRGWDSEPAVGQLDRDCP